MPRQRRDAADVDELDVEQVEAVFGELFGQQPIRRRLQRQLPEAGLDGDFPTARHADQRLVGVDDGLAGTCRQARIVGDEPEEGVRVEQDARHRYGAKSSSGASKSAAIAISPRADPGVRAPRRMGTTRTSGLPSLAMTTSPPARTSRTKPDSPALAFAMLYWISPFFRAMLVILHDQHATGPARR